MRPGRARSAWRVGLPLLVVVLVYAVVLPRLADLSDAWHLVLQMTGAEALAVAAATAVNVASYALVAMAAVPGLGWRRAMVVDQVSTAVANTVPAGFAVGVGTMVTIYTSYGFPPSVITRTVLLTGLWNTLVKLVVPLLAVVGLAATADVGHTLTVAALLGVGLLAAVVVVVLVTTGHRRGPAALAGTAQRLVTPAARRLGLAGPTGWAAAVDRFLVLVRGGVRDRWRQLSAAALASHLALFLVLLTALHAVGGDDAQVPWLRVLGVFAVTRLLTMVPITPGALGVAELSYVAGLIAVGVGPDAAAGAVLVFRVLTWFLPLPLGGLCFLAWRHDVRQRPGGRRLLGGSPVSVLR